MQTAIISVADGTADVWARDYVAVYLKRQKKVDMNGSITFVNPRHNVMMPKNAKPDDVIKTVKTAVKVAGVNGTLVFNVGHGVAGSSSSGTDGWVDLSPNHSFKLGGLNTTNTFVNVFYDFAIPRPGMVAKSDLDNDKQYNPQSEKLKNWMKYQELAQIIKDGKLKKVVFLTCNIGNATDFLRKIALDFDTVCEAFKHKIQLTPQKNRVRIHLQTDPDGKFTNIPENEEELLSGLQEIDVIRVKPNK